MHACGVGGAYLSNEPFYYIWKSQFHFLRCPPITKVLDKHEDRFTFLTTFVFSIMINIIGEFKNFALPFAYVGCSNDFYLTWKEAQFSNEGNKMNSVTVVIII